MFDTVHYMYKCFTSLRLEVSNLIPVDWQGHNLPIVAHQFRERVPERRSLAPHPVRPASDAEVDHLAEFSRVLPRSWSVA